MWPLSDNECYISVDIEADGPVPGLNSMLSLGAALFTHKGRLADTFSVNLQTLPGACENLQTMQWWTRQPEAWETCRRQTQGPGQAMRSFVDWVRTHAQNLGAPVMVAYPAAYDAMWVQWYMHRFTGDDCFRLRVIDIRTLAMAAMGKGYRETAKARMPKRWCTGTRHTHVAVDDAKEQGEIFMNIVRELDAKHSNLIGQD